MGLLFPGTGGPFSPSGRFFPGDGGARFSPLLRGASCGADRLTRFDVAGVRDDLLPWDPVRLLGVLVYLVLVPVSLR